MELSDTDLMLKKIMEVSQWGIFIVTIFLKSYFLNSSMKNKALKEGISIIVFILSRDIGKLITHDIGQLRPSLCPPSCPHYMDLKLTKKQSIYSILGIENKISV